ncbi:hypothetical protein RB595_010453 [Gaeumannomyces hyphopodioides]
MSFNTEDDDARRLRLFGFDADERAELDALMEEDSQDHGTVFQPAVIRFSPAIPFPGLAPVPPFTSPPIPAYPAGVSRRISALTPENEQHRLALRLLAEEHRQQVRVVPDASPPDFTGKPRRFPCGNCYVADLLRGGTHSEDDLACSVGFTQLSRCFQCARRGWLCRPLPREFPFTIDVKLMQALWWVHGGIPTPAVSAMRLRGVLNLFLWENLNGSSVTTHPSARHGLNYSAMDGGRTSTGAARLTPNGPNSRWFPWDLVSDEYHFPSPRDLLALVRFRRFVVDGGYEFGFYPDAHVRHASRRELAQVNAVLADIGLQPIRFRASVMARENYLQPFRVAYYSIMPHKGSDPIRLLEPAPHWHEVPNHNLGPHDSDEDFEESSDNEGMDMETETGDVVMFYDPAGDLALHQVSGAEVMIRPAAEFEDKEDEEADEEADETGEFSSAAGSSSAAWSSDAE